MFTMMQLTEVSSSQEAYELAQKRGARYLGGLMWLKLGDGVIREGIDLSALGLNKIKEVNHPDLGQAIQLGAMVTLGEFENNESISVLLQDANKDCVDGIVGVQFRNGATIGGSVAMKAGFSDVCNLLLAIGAYVELEAAGLLSMEDFTQGDYRNDLVKYIYLTKEYKSTFYKNYRLDSGDLPCANASLVVAEDGKTARICVGARPALAKSKDLSSEEWAKLGEAKNRDELKEGFTSLITDFNFASNVKASAAYRRNLAIILLTDLYSQWKES